VLTVYGHYVSVVILGVLAADISIVGIAFAVASHVGEWVGEAPLWPKALALCAVTLCTLYVAELYRADYRPGRRELVVRLFLALAACGLIVAALGYAFPVLRLGRMALLQMFTLIGVGLFLWRLTWDCVRNNSRLRTRVLVLGVSRAAERLVGLQGGGAQPFHILGFLDDDPAAHDRLPAGGELLGKSRDLLTLVDELQPDLVVVALSDMRGALPTSDLLECRLRGIRVEDWPTFYEKQTGKVLVTDLRPSWLIFSNGFVKTQLMQALKRVLDVTLALAGLALALPVMALVGLAIKLESSGPVLFRQQRVGQSGRIFTLNKFRSMRHDAERTSGPVWATEHDPRVTRVGRVLRKTRLDELPQLFNVLAGEMSFVGPRPERPEFVRLLQRQIPFYSGRLAVKPGITGWAQVRHQYAASVEDTLEKLQYDLYYIKNLSPFLDILILLNTIQVVLFARGAR
jgi:sugar transferase (PEP-CTERM system associated)